MPFRWELREHLLLGRYVLRWLLLLLPIAGAIGSACALFLWALDIATRTRWNHPWLLYLLPLAGMAIVGLYGTVGKSAERGTNLLMDEIHEPGAGVPRRMAPLILIATVITHLFGGSAGREGTAVQMGGSLASAFGRSVWGRWFKLDAADMRTLLMAGVAAGFAGVFGTPLTGAIFAMEVLALGRMSYEALVPCLIGALIGDWSCTAWGVHHTEYRIEVGPDGTHGLDIVLALKVVVAAVAFGLASVLFAELTHTLQHLLKTRVRSALLRPVVGSLVIVALVQLLGTRDYLGLGVESPDANGVSIVSSFQAGGSDTWSWWWKLLFTAITLSCGFKGGEVTPLFFIGAALGNTLSGPLHAPTDLFAGLGFIAVFAGATNTPLACTVMGMELFGAHYAPYFMIACFLAYLFSGHGGIYTAQRIGTAKHGSATVPLGASLQAVRQWREERRKPQQGDSAP